MKFLKYLILLILILLVVASVYLATLNGAYDVSRSRTIKADPAVVFNDLNDYRNWADWGPWYETDSTIVVNYAENTIGEGAWYSWISTEGDGEMRTLKTMPPDRIEAEIIYKTPFGEMRSDVYWIIKPVDSGTDLTWGIKGEMPFITRFMASSMEEQMGPMEERGLELFDANLMRKLQVYSIENKGVVDFSGGFYLYLTSSSRISTMNSKFGEMMKSIELYMESNSISTLGSPFTIYHKFDPENDTAMFSVCYPVKERILTDKGTDILTGFTDRGIYLKTVLKGSYDYSNEAWEQAMSNTDRLSEFTTDTEREPFQIFVNNPSNTPNPANLLTEIYIPVH